MKKTTERKLDRADSRTLLTVLAVFVLVVILGVFAFRRFYRTYIDDVLYRERLNQMKEVTGQLFAGLEDVIENYWEKTDAFEKYIERAQPQTAQELLHCNDELYQISSLEQQQAQVIAVDELGRYMTEEGWQGAIAEMELLLDMPERVSFVSKVMTRDDTFVYFLNRLQTPVSIQDGERTVNIIYFGIAQNMNRLNTYFRCEAYDNSNSMYVLDTQGTRLFYSNGVLPGYNAYTTLQEMEYLHGNSFDEAKQMLDTTGCGYANAVLDGEEYYYALHHAKHATWTLLFLVPSSRVATDVVEMIDKTARIILAFALILLAVSVGAIFHSLRFKQKQTLAIERANNEKLSRINDELTQAVKTAERAEREANAANRAKSDFLSSMSHDIRTPMNAIVGITGLMAHEKDNSEKMQAYIHKVQLSSQYLLGLINDILDMSKIESGQVVLNREPLSLSEQLGQTDSIIRAQAAEKKQTLMVRAHEIRHEFLIGDSVRLRQILMNLLSNAVKYTPEGGTICFDLAELPCRTPDSASFRFTVEDNGYGMPEEFLQHIFEPFTRAANASTRHAQGSGLGMAITKNIVELMGGEITVESRLGAGSRFAVTLTFPIDEQAECLIDANRVLLVTDDAALEESVRVWLGETGVTLFTAAAQTEAEAIVRRQEVDVILLADRRLMGCARALRQAARGAVLVFCMDDAQEQKLQPGGAVDGLIQAPFFPSRLAQAIDHVCNAGAAADENGSVMQGMRFICAEDNALNAEILKTMLDMKGASCEIYPDGEKLVRAFAAVKPGEYDAVLMDIQMPVMNGLEAARAIRQGENPLGKTIPIIAMTANAFSDDVQNCIDAGMDAHVAKPLDIAVLERALQACLHANSCGGGGHLSARRKHNEMKCRAGGCSWKS